MEKKIIVGHIGADATVKQYGATNAEFIVFSIATTRKIWKEGIPHKSTIWTQCFFFCAGGYEKRKQLAPYLRRGASVYVEGTPSEEVFHDKGGVPHVGYALNVDRLEICAQSRTQQGASQEDA